MKINRIFKITAALILLGFMIVVVIYFTTNRKQEVLQDSNADIKGTKEYKDIDFAKVHEDFLFSAKIPNEFEVEYLPKTKAINIYNPALAGEDTLEESQIYISFFRANSFLTLSSVNILRQEESLVSNHEAVLYEIAKKDLSNKFSNQPDWRNFKHIAVDVRYSEINPTYFYSFAQNPNFNEEKFSKFLDSIIFYENK